MREYIDFIQDMAGTALLANLCVDVMARREFAIMPSSVEY